MTSILTRLRPVRARLASLLLALYLPACGSWQLGAPTPAEFIEKERPSEVRVTRVDGSVIDLENPSIRGDSLLGTAGQSVAPYGSRQQVTIALSEVQTVAVRHTSELMTVLFAGAIVAIVGVVYCAASSGDFSPC